MSHIEYETFGQELVFHTAPTLLGIKCVNLISLPKDRFDIHSHIRIFNSRASGKSLKIKKLYDYENRSLLLIYNEKLMKKRISDDEVREILPC